MFASCLRDEQAVAHGARLVDEPAGTSDRTNRASIGIFQQQSFLVGVSPADRTDTHGLSEDLFAVVNTDAPPSRSMTSRQCAFQSPERDSHNAQHERVRIRRNYGTKPRLSDNVPRYACRHETPLRKAGSFRIR